MARFIGRERELKKLRSLLDKQSASFVVIRGRRRVGKSRLIREFGAGMDFRFFIGLPPNEETTKQGQIAEFCRQMSRNFGMPVLRAEDWGEIFWHLGKQVERGRVVLALDEISCIGSKDPDFLGQLKNAWDLYFSQNPELIVIVCGSVSSWIEKNLLSSTGFVGRISMDMVLKELPLHDAVQFWGARRDRLSSYELFKVLAVTGGIPRYLEEVRPNLTVEANIEQLCFDPTGFLFNEFEKIFSDLFSRRAAVYARIVEVLSFGSAEWSTISKSVGVKRRASIQEYLHDLVQAGFVSVDPTWDLRSLKVSSVKKYRLSDNYLRFYLRYVHPMKIRLRDEPIEPAALSLLPEWPTIMRLQFENVVLANVSAVLDLIGLSRAQVVMFGPYFQRATKRVKGCQIDLLIQTRFRTLFLCEVKFSSYPIGVAIGQEIEKKEAAISLPRGWSLRRVLIHVNGVTNELERSALFDHIVDFEQLLRPR